MSKVCYRQATRTLTDYGTSIIRSTSFRTSVTVLSPTGTRLVGQTSTTRIPVVTSYTSYVTRRTTYYSSICTTARGSKPYPYYGLPGVRLSTGFIVFIVLVGLWALVFLGVVIYLLCFSRTAKRGRRPKGQGTLNQNQFQNYQPQQQYTPVPQDALYSQPETHYTPPSNQPYGQQNLDAGTYPGYQNYNAPNLGAQGPTQWATQVPGSPSVGSVTPGPGPGYIPPGAANPMYGNPGPGTTLSYYSTTPSPPPGPPGQGSDPHRMLYTQQNDRLSAAVSLVHSDQSQQPQYPTTGPPYDRPSMNSSPPHLATQYRGYAEPSTFANYNNNNGGRF